ncbi:MAG: hypothetical protein K2N30_04235 [Clostridia bacterium]|nr:hypothetical protein [Clostridia bacterium]
MMFRKEKIYEDTVEIVKAAVNSDSQLNHLLNVRAPEFIAEYIKTVYKTLTELNENP